MRIIHCGYFTVVQIYSIIRFIYHGVYDNLTLAWSACCCKGSRCWKGIGLDEAAKPISSSGLILSPLEDNSLWGVCGGVGGSPASPLPESLLLSELSEWRFWCCCSSTNLPVHDKQEILLSIQLYVLFYSHS